MIKIVETIFVNFEIGRKIRYGKASLPPPIPKKGGKGFQDNFMTLILNRKNF